MAAARVGGVDGGAAWCSDAFDAFALPARGHALARLGGDVIIAGRRPGAYAAIVDPSDVKRPARILAPQKDCVFAGHAAAARDGKFFVTSEFESATTKGALVVRDVATGAPRTRWDPSGIEPHDLLFAKGGARLVVAIGGLIRDGGVRGPAFNPGGINSAIVEIDAASGRALARHKLAPDLGSLSLRHMAVAPDGETIAFGMQDQDLSTARPLVGVLRVGRGIELLPLPTNDANAFRGYIGSLAIDAGGRFIAATSPRGGMLGLWSLANGRWLGGLAIPDVCGLAADKDAGVFWATSGEGQILKLRASDAGPIIAMRWHVEAQFDNHLLRL